MKFKSMALLMFTMAMPAMADQVSVNTQGLSRVLEVENGQPAKYLYFGSRLDERDKANLSVTANGRMDVYPAYGLNTAAESALALRHFTMAT